VLAMLAWVASVFAGKAVSPRHRWLRGDMCLDDLRRMVLQLIVIRAGELVRTRARNVTLFQRGRSVCRRHFLRSVIGSRLRRRLQHKNPAARVAILIGVLRDLDSFARPLAQRVRHSLTRLFPITSIAALTVVIPAEPALTISLSDSS
jgi:hypothetical protein